MTTIIIDLRKLTNKMKTKKTNDLQMFPPIDVNVLSIIHNDSKQELATTKVNTEYIID